MNFLEIVGAITLLALGAGLAWVAWEFARYFGRGVRNALIVLAAERADGTVVPLWRFLWRLPVMAWWYADASAVTLGSGRWISFRPDEDEDDQ